MNESVVSSLAFFIALSLYRDENGEKGVASVAGARSSRRVAVPSFPAFRRRTGQD